MGQRMNILLGGTIDLTRIFVYSTKLLDDIAFIRLFPFEYILIEAKPVFAVHMQIDIE